MYLPLFASGKGKKDTAVSSLLSDYQKSIGSIQFSMFLFYLPQFKISAWKKNNKIKSNKIKYLHESFDGEYIDGRTNKKLPEWDFPVVAMVEGREEYVHSGDFCHFILLTLTFLPPSSPLASLPFHWEPRFQGTCPVEGYKASISETELQMPSASTSILVLQIKQLACWP